MQVDLEKKLKGTELDQKRKVPLRELDGQKDRGGRKKTGEVGKKKQKEREPEKSLRSRERVFFFSNKEIWSPPSVIFCLGTPVFPMDS
jgi:hypothetical protein